MKTTQDNRAIDQRDIFIQAVKIKDSKQGIGIIAIRESGSDSYEANKYELKEDNASLLDVKTFKGQRRAKNYSDLQDYVKEITKTKAVSYNYDSDNLIGRFSCALENALRNHICMD